MPNWKITRRQHEEIKQVAAMLVDRRLAMARSGFPLTEDDVQLSVMAAEDVVTVRRLRTGGMTSIPVYQGVTLLLIPEKHNVQRTTVVNFGKDHFDLFLPQGNKHEQHGGYARTNRLHERAHYQPDPSIIPPERMEAFVKWADNMVREYRLAETAVYAVKYMLENYIETTADIAVKWPLLEVLMHSGDLKSRVAHVPKHTKRYEFQNSGPIPKLRQVAEAVLLAADMLPTKETPRQPTEWRANLGAWVPKPGDWKPGDHS